MSKLNANSLRELAQKGRGPIPGIEADWLEALQHADAWAILEAKLEAMERLKTYAMLLESHVGYGYVNEIRHQLGVTDEMINWIIPADHRKLLDAAQEEQE